MYFKHPAFHCNFKVICNFFLLFFVCFFSFFKCSRGKNFTYHHWRKSLYWEAVRKHHSREYMGILCAFLPTLLSAQAPLSLSGPRQETVSLLRHMAVLMLYTRNMTNNSGRDSIPTVGWVSLQAGALTCYCFFQKVTSLESSAHLAYNTRVFHPRVHYEWKQYGLIWIELTSLGASHCICYGCDVICIQWTHVLRSNNCLALDRTTAGLSCSVPFNYVI